MIFYGLYPTSTEGIKTKYTSKNQHSGHNKLTRVTWNINAGHRTADSQTHWIRQTRWTLLTHWTQRPRSVYDGSYTAGRIYKRANRSHTNT